jgi:hypothetical protein
MSARPAFHMLLSTAAVDISTKQGKEASEESIKHQAITIRVVNENLLRMDCSDSNLAAVALLAGNEVILHSPSSSGAQKVAIG